MNKAMHKLMLSCETATFYITKKEYQKLSCKENLQLNMHLMGCKFCRAFNKQNSFLSEKISTLKEHPPVEKLSENKRAEIRNAMDKEA